MKNVLVLYYVRTYILSNQESIEQESGTKNQEKCVGESTVQVLFTVR